MVEKSEKEEGPIAAPGSPFGVWAGAASRGLTVAVLVVLTWYIWSRWGDFQVDCGRELRAVDLKKQ